MEWTDERLEPLTPMELKNLLHNVGTRLAAGRVSTEVADDLCRRIEARMSAVRKAKFHGSRAPRELTLEKRVAIELGVVAEALAKRYDLSPETAIKLSAGAKNFKAHNLTAKNGEAKTGGAKKEGKLSIDRYLSYRVGESLVTLAFILFKDEPEEAARYYVMGTDDVMLEGQRFAELLADKTGYGWSPAFTARLNVGRYDDLGLAASAYEALIAKLAPALETQAKD
jgi:hypothetical protein